MEKIENLFVHWINVVVIANFHNPSILNPDFLVINDIVPKDWEVVENLTTPPFSAVKYKNNIHITVSEQRLEVKEEINKYEIPSYSEVYKTASNYISVLRHVHFLTLGLNWSVTYLCDEPDLWIINNMLKEKFSKDINLDPALIKAGINLTYNLHDSLCNIKLFENSFEDNENNKNIGINFNFNFSHHSEQKPFPYKKLIEKISNWDTLQQFALTRINDIINR